MRKVLCNPLPQPGKTVALDDVESKHLIAVLRVENGESVQLIDGFGKTCTAQILIRNKSAFAEGLTAPTTDDQLISKNLHLLAAILKSDAMEWVIEKAVELGVRSLAPIEADHSVVQMKKKGPEEFLERWQKIADQSLKQCGRLDRLVILLPQTLEQAIATRDQTLPLFWFDEASTTPLPPLTQILDAAHSGAAYLIGPEGGFSPKERNRLIEIGQKNNSQTHLTGQPSGAIIRCSLGKIILRAETAAIAGAAVLSQAITTGGQHGKGK